MTIPRQAVMYSTDRQYWVHTYVSLYSLLINNQDVSFDVYIVSEAPDDQFFANSARLKDIHSDVEISWAPVNHELLPEAPIIYSGMASYYRLLIGRLLPGTVRRVLYLDADTIVRGSLRDLFMLDIDDCVLAAIPDYVPLRFQPESPSHATRLGLPEGTPTFNAGVLCINLDMWRDLQIEELSRAYIEANTLNPSRLAFADQDAMNAVVVGKWRSIGPNFNFNEWTTDPQRLNDFDPGTQFGGQISASGPAITHYADAGGIKPWHGGCRNAYASDYWHYRQQTPYADRRQLLRSQLVGVMRYTMRQTILLVRKLPWGNLLLHIARSLLAITRISVPRGLAP